MGDTEILLGWAVEGITVENSEIAWYDILPDATETFTDSKKQYQQGHNECVITSVRWCVADNTSIDYSLEDQNNMRKMLPDYWWDSTMGMYLDKGGALVVDYTRATYNIPLTQLRYLTYEGSNLSDILNKGYSCQIWLRVNSDFYKDVMDNAQINYAIPKKGMWHSIRSIRRSTTNNNYLIDNNVDRLGDKNVIELTPAMFDTWLQNKVFFNNFYIYYIPQAMITDTIPHYTGDTPREKEVVKAWEDLVNAKKFTPSATDYTWHEWYLKINNEVMTYKFLKANNIAFSQ